jgi:hypothetical protein
VVRQGVGLEDLIVGHLEAERAVSWVHVPHHEHCYDALP